MAKKNVGSSKPKLNADAPPSRDKLLQKAELVRLNRIKTIEHTKANKLGPELIQFFKQNVQKKQTQFGKISACWINLVPLLLSDHCALESFSRGTLTVLVDNSSHLYGLKQLLLAGLQQQILLACKATGLRKIVLKPGRWYAQNEEARKLKFE